MTQPKVLALIGASYVYGKEVVGLQALRTLQKYGYDVLVMTNGWNDGAFAKELDKTAIAHKPVKLGWFYLTKPLWTLDTLIHLPAAIFKARYILRSRKDAIIYTDTYRALVTLNFLLKKNSIVFHVHEEHAGISRGRKYIQMVAPKVKTFIAVSEFIKKDLLACGVPAEKIKVVYNPVQEGNTVKVYMPEGILRLAIVGQILETKGHEDLIDALLMIKNTVRFHLDIVGTGNEDYIQHIKSKIAAGGLDALVSWKGFVKEKSDVYENADIVIVPSRKDESFGLVAAEAGMYGCPAIVANSGGLSEIVMDGETGFFIPKKDPSAIATSITRLYNDKELMSSMGNKGREHTQRRFGIKNFETRIIAAL